MAELTRPTKNRRTDGPDQDISGILLGLCNPLLDISAEVSQELLDKYGVKANDAILAEEKHMPVYSELVSDFPVQYIAGGAGQNSIRVAQWMIGQPGATGFFGCVGNDQYGQQMREEATSDGVNVLYQVDPDQPTGTCAVLITGHARSLIANLAAANHFKPAHLEVPECKAAYEKAQYIYITGFFLTVSLESILAFGKHFAEEGKVVCMNLSAPFIVQFFTDQFLAALPYTDYIFGNETETEALGEKMGWGKDLRVIARKLAMMPKASGLRPRTVIITQGAQEIICFSADEYKTYEVEQIPAEEMVDTNGAGDAFVGGFLSQLVQGESMDKCVDAGKWAAKLIIQRSGCSFPAQCEYGL